MKSRIRQGMVAAAAPAAYASVIPPPSPPPSWTAATTRTPKAGMELDGLEAVSMESWPTSCMA